jgi:Protein of unknown function (DUF1681)
MCAARCMGRISEAQSDVVQIIDAAMDSSRYFALRIENPETGSHVFIGIGFAERETAGHFKLTLAEHGRCRPHFSSSHDHANALYRCP